MDNQDVFNDKVWKLLKERAQMSKEECLELLKDPVIDRCLGAMFGAFIGDALGSYCEFQTHIEKKVLEKTMKMPGEGVFGTMAGQVTDDSELALHLLEGLLDFNPKDKWDVIRDELSLSIADQYLQWYKSQPFDIGDTTKNALKIIHKNNIKVTRTPGLKSALKDIEHKNRNSLSNGFLMRNTPLVIFKALLMKYRFQEFKENKVAIEQIIKNEINMTHGHETTFQCGREWIELLNLIVHRPNAVDVLPYIYTKFYERPAITEDFQQWKDRGESDDLMEAHYNIGYAKIVFTYAMFYFRKILKQCKKDEDLNPQLYKQIIRDMISKAGDTDTNACIVGALVGSIVGFHNLPKQYVKKQLTLDLVKGDMPVQRPEFYEPRRGFVNFFVLLKKIRGQELKNFKKYNVIPQQEQKPSQIPLKKEKEDKEEKNTQITEQSRP